MSIRVGFMSPKAGGMIIRWGQMRVLRTYYQGPVFVMVIRIANPSVQHQVADKDIDRCINAREGSPTDWHMYLYILQNSKDMLKRMLSDSAGLLSWICGEQICQ
jgi:hypothetical protein